MQISVLGPFSLRNATTGAECTPVAPKPRQLLALMALKGNEFVSTSMCIDELWPVVPPRSAVTTVRTYVMQARRSIRTATAAGGGDRILSTRQRGYQLSVARDQLDLFRFIDLTEHAKQALQRGELERGAATLRQALALWQGPALADVHAGPLITRQLARLEETRFTGLELRIEADLQLGLHNELIGELLGLIEEFPVHENLHAQLMVALCRAGRQVQALEVFRRLRGVLAEELGIGPSRRMERLHEAVLSGDAALDPPNHTSPVTLRSLDIMGKDSAA